MVRKFGLGLVVGLVTVGFVLGASAAPSYNPITAGLLAAYEFSGNANDVSGNGHDGTVNGATLVADRFGVENSAYDFDGINDNIIIGAVLTNSDSLSIAAWVSRTAFSNSWQDIVAGDCTGGPLFGFTPGPGSAAQPSQRLAFGGQCNQPFPVVYDPAETSVITDDLWHAVAVTYDGATVSLYQDGNLIASGAGSGSFDIAKPLGIGSAPSYETFAGLIDDVYIYDRALSSTEVQTLYSVVPEPSTALLLGLGLIGFAVRGRRV